MVAARRAAAAKVRADYAASRAAERATAWQLATDVRSARLELERVHSVDFTPAWGSGAKRAQRLICVIESRLPQPATKPLTSRPGALFEPCAPTRSQFRAEPRPLPPSKAVAVDEALLAAYRSAPPPGR